ncbi:hypothetical protein [Paenibacillus arenosi]|uniref:Uncharacterized protein n=1 Tax=Paenibacillus arenosi TaxID=2774142 RepID=A0ABR9AYU6_9BACL|nr:hypothetical protein [Paenibacillus arenosi]MBD8498863.1 hypothetical protein [Paenibacillus arenosi]
MKGTQEWKSNIFIDVNKFTRKNASEEGKIDIIDVLAKANHYGELLTEYEQLAAQLEEAQQIITEQCILLNDMQMTLDSLSIEEAVPKNSPPIFPDEFHHYKNESYNEQMMQGLIDAVKHFQLAEGETCRFSYRNNTIIRMHEGDKIVTLFTDDYFEHIENLVLTNGM